MTFSWIRYLLHPPIFPDNEEKTYLASILHDILFGTLVIPLVLVILFLLVGEITLLRLAYADFWVLLGLGGLWMLRRGWVQLVGIFYLAAGWLGVSFIAWQAGGVRTIGFASYIIVILLAGLIFRTWGGAIVALLSMISGAAFIYSVDHGLIPPPRLVDSDWGIWGGLSINFVGAAVVVHLAISRLYKSLQQLQQRRQNLLAAHARLEDEIAKHTRTLNHLRQREQNFAALADNAQDGIAIFAGPGELLYGNPHLAHMLGYEQTALLELTIQDIVHPDELALVIERYQSRLAGEWVPPRYETRLKTKIGQTIYVEITAARTIWQEMAADIVVFRDTTQRHKAELAVRQAEKRYRELFEEAPVMYVITANRDGRPIIVDCNTQFLRTVQRERDDVLGRPLAAFYTLQSRQVLLTEGGYQRALSGDFAAEERQLLAADGVVVETLLRARPEQNEHGQIWGTRATFIDISARKRAEAALQALNADLETRVAERTAALRETNERLRAEISERIRASTALHRSEKQYRDLIEAADDAILLLDLDFNILLSNSALYTMLGHQRDQSYQPDVMASVHPEDRLQLRRKMKELLSTGRSTIEYRIKHKASHWIDVLARSVLLRDGDGHPEGILSILRDISNRKQAEKALQESEQRLRAIFENVAVMVAVTDTQGHWLQVNRYTLELLNYSAGELFEQPTEAFTHPDDLQKSRDCYQQLINGKIKHYRIELRYLAKGGQIIWGDLSASPLFDQQGRVVAVIGVVVNITARKRMEEDLRRYERIVSANPDSMSLVDRGYIYRIANDAYQRRFDRPYEEIIGQSVPALLGEVVFEKVIKHNLDRSLAGEMVNYQSWFEFEGSRQRYMDVTYSPYRGAQGLIEGVVVTSRDITSLKEAEDAMLEQKRFIESVAEASPNVLYVLSLAENRNVYINREITTILGYTEAEIAAMGSDIMAILVHPDDLADFPRRLAELAALPAGQVYEHEYRLQHKNGEWRWLFSRELVFRRATDGTVLETLGTAQDITKRKATETALQESEARLRGIIENTEAGYFFIDTEGIFRDINPAWLRMHGYESADEVIGRHFSLTQVETELARARMLSKQVLDGQRISAGTFSRLCRDGSIKYHSYSLTPVIKDGQVIGIEGFMTDTTALHQLAAKLEKSERLLQDAERLAGLGAWEWDLETDIWIFSRGWQRIHGVQREHLSSTELEPLIHPDDKEAVFKALHETVTAGRPYDLQHRIIRQDDGETRFLQVYGEMLADESGHPLKLYGAALDITRQIEAERALRQAYDELEARVAMRTAELSQANANLQAEIAERERSERALRDSEERFRQVIISISDHIYVTRIIKPDQFVNQYLSPHVEALTGYPVEAFMADWSYWPQRVIHPEDRLLAAGHLAELAQGKSGEVEYRLVRADGSVLWVRDSARVVQRADGRILYGLVSDITARKQTEAEITLLNQHLEQRVATRTRELSALYEVTAIAGQMLALSTILERSLEQVLTGLRVDTGAIHLLNEARTELVLAAQKGLRLADLAPLKVLINDQRLAGWILDDRKPLMIPNLAGKGRFKMATYPAGYRTYAGAPIRAGGRVLGVLSIFGRQEAEFSLEEAILLASIGDQLGVSIENARLRQQAEQAAVAAERERLARELHDSVTQSLYSLTLFSAGTLEQVGAGKLETLEHNLQRIGETAYQALKEMRLLVYELRPIDLERDGLVGALRRRLSMVEKRTNVDARLVTDEQIELSPQIEEGFYRITQEALNNALKHGQVTAVIIYLRQRDDYAELEVIDDGIGFEPAAVNDNGGLGLVSMRERAEQLGGTLKIYSEPGRGTRVLVRVAYQPNQNQ